MERNKTKAIVFAFLAAVFYALNVPISKILLEHVGPATMASLLYLGAGIGVGLMYLFSRKDGVKLERLTKSDLPFVIGMIVLDIAAPIFLMLGINYGSSANASLLGNFEIVSTTLIALIIFKESISKKLWTAIALITLSSTLLSFEGIESLKFSYGSLLVLLATICWGFENNCTRKISSKNTYEIVILKGIFSGLGSLVISVIKRESFPGFGYIFIALALGFVAYGLSIFLYVRAQNVLGAAKTSACYAVNPFIGAMFALILLKETLSWMYLVTFLLMFIGTALVVIDTLNWHHIHEH